ncbi:UNC-like C-terminal-domain-containing protein [Dissophora ornata]|nr:UNC-like C-terminal-domain-containing protein [Dissophora ornata]
MQVDNRFYMLDRRVSSAEQRLYEVNDEVESLRQYFIDDEWIEGRVATLVELHQQQHESKATIADKHALPTDSRSLTNVEHQAIQDLIDEALEKYAADVLAKPDYALHSAGGRIIPQMTFFNFLITEEPTYLGRLLGLVHLMPAQQNIQVENFAVKAIQPDMHMGACWAMNGTQGQIAIRLSRRVVVTEVTVEHVDPRVAFDVRSAPKEMEVWRLAAPLGKEKEGDDGTTGSTSTFHVPRSKQNVPSYGVVVKVNSNWGHPDFTCLYRVRVHGYEPTQGVS